VRYLHVLFIQGLRIRSHIFWEARSGSALGQKAGSGSALKSKFGSYRVTWRAVKAHGGGVEAGNWSRGRSVDQIFADWNYFDNDPDPH
jgi:hypothetical protein